MRFELPSLPNQQPEPAAVHAEHNPEPESARARSRVAHHDMSRTIPVLDRASESHHEHPRLALDGVAPRLFLGHLRILRVRLLSIAYYKKSSASSGNTKRTPPGVSAGYPRQANRGTGLGRGDPSAEGASGLLCFELTEGRLQTWASVS